MARFGKHRFELLKVRGYRAPTSARRIVDAVGDRQQLIGMVDRIDRCLDGQ